MSLGTVFVSEVLGTGILLLLGAGVVANVLLAKSKGKDGGWLLINFGWGLGVFAGVFVAYKSGAHLNPAVTVGILTSGAADTYAPGVPVSVRSRRSCTSPVRSSARSSARCLAFLAYSSTSRRGARRGSEARGVLHRSGDPQPRLEPRHEVIGTFVLVLVILAFGKTPTQIGPLAVGAARCRHRRLARWPHRLRDQPGP